MKKTILSVFAALLIFGNGVAQNKLAPVSVSTGVIKTNQASLTSPTEQPKLASAQSRCATLTPPAEWDIAFNKEVERFKADLVAGKVQLAANYTIPVIVHILHNGDAVGSNENISAAQVQSQIDVLNADFNGTGYGVNGTPSVWQSLIANCGITFCLAKQDVNGNALAEYGIDRINWTQKSGWSNPATIPDLSTLINHYNGVVKPQSIWDPTKYFNFWVADFDPNVLLGFGNFPAGTSLSGLTSGAVETAQTAGCLASTRVFGTVGYVANNAASALYNKGRTTTHEVGHNLGLRHIWGDAACGDDYCADTPPAAAYNLGNQNGSCVSLPFHAGTCSGNSPNGEMVINFMDYTNDECMWMFTNDQKVRMLTALTTGTYRAPLLTSNKCQASGTFVIPVANFSGTPTTVSTGSTVSFTDLSSGPATSWSWSFPGGTPSSSTQQNPTITYNTPGTYDVTLTATNTAGSDGETKVGYITVVAAGTSCDTITNIGNQQATWYTLGSGNGYLSGHNKYLQKAMADKYTVTANQIGFKLQGAYVGFALAKGTGSVKIASWNNAGTSGTPGTMIGSKTVTNSSITTGQSSYYDFATQPTIGSSFYVGIELTYAAGDTVVLYTTAHDANWTNTGWEQESDGTWMDYSSVWNLGQNNPLKCSHFIWPVICPSTGIGENMLSANTRLYPNPTSGELFINIAQLQSTDLTIEVYNLVGQVVETATLKNVLVGNYAINLANQQNGVYFVKINNGIESSTKRIVLSH